MSPKRIGIAVFLALLSGLLIVSLIPGFFAGAPTIDPPAAEEEDPLPLPEDELDDDFEVGSVACDGDIPEGADEPKPQWDEPPETVIDPDASYRAVLETSCGTVVVDLFADRAPVTVNNFVFLAQEGFYDAVVFHRIAPGFVIQGGDPEGTGHGGPGYRFEDELDLAEERGYPHGTLAMANAGPDTNGSQFFFALQDLTGALRPAYTVFGEVVEGMEAIHRIAEVPVLEGSERPLQVVFIERVTIEQDAAGDDDIGDNAGDDADDDADDE
jgi:cyclophilin family peptidyl-prolyl cis-trans isomerase